MYNPFFQNYGHFKALEAILSDFPNLTYVSMVSFTMRCRFSIDPELRKIQSNELVVYDVELSEFIQRKLLRFKSESIMPILSDETIARIHETISSANILDPAIRSKHIEKLKGDKP